MNRLGGEIWKSVKSTVWIDVDAGVGGCGVHANRVNVKRSVDEEVWRSMPREITDWDGEYDIIADRVTDAIAGITYE